MRKLLTTLFILFASVLFGTETKAQLQLYICGTVVGNSGQSITVYMVDSMSGQLFSTTTDTNGLFCDTITVPQTQGYIHVFIVDCYGNMVNQVLTYWPTNQNFNLTFNFCNTITQPVILCVTVSNIPSGPPVPVYAMVLPNGIPDTLYAQGPGTVTVCDTLNVINPGGNVSVNMTDCNNNYQTQVLTYSNFFPYINANFNYCPPGGNCYAYWTSTYDSITNTFYITVDSITMSQAVSYFWSFGDNTTSTLSNPTHQYNSNGLYNVCLTILTGNGDTCSYCHMIGIDSIGNIYLKGGGGFNLVVLPQNPTSLIDVSTSDVKLFPNPADNFINLKLPVKTETVEVSLFNMQGKEVNRFITGSLTEPRLDVSRLPAGLYTVKISSTTINRTLQFVKQ